MIDPRAEIPRTQAAAAETFGKLVAQRVLDPEDAAAALFAAAKRAGHSGDDAGLRTRLWWRLRDSADRWRIARALAENRVRKAIAPLLDARAPSTDIRHEAYTANHKDGEPLLPREVRAIVEEEMIQRLQRQTRRAYGR